VGARSNSIDCGALAMFFLPNFLSRLPGQGHNFVRSFIDRAQGPGGYSFW
jgi:hypothetical protein